MASVGGDKAHRCTLAHAAPGGAPSKRTELIVYQSCLWFVVIAAEVLRETDDKLKEALIKLVVGRFPLARGARR
jgi:hypothetical protein